MSDDWIIAEVADLFHHDPESRLRQCKVTAVNASALTVSIQVGGSTTNITDVKFLETYYPRVDDIVWAYRLGRTWIVIGYVANISRIPNTTELSGNNTAINSATFVDFANISFSWRKIHTSTQILAQTVTSGYSSNTAVNYEVAVQLTGTSPVVAAVDYSVGQFATNDTNHHDWVRNGRLSSVAAGLYTCKLRLRSMAGGTFTSDANDRCCLILTEIAVPMST